MVICQRSLLTIVLTAIGILSSAGALAANFKCKGVDRADNDQKVEIDVSVADSESLTFVDLEGDEHELDRLVREDESRYKYAVYADNGYDGYGGFIKVSVPKEVAEQGSTKNFVVYYLWHLYSELGLVHVTDVKATCKVAAF